VAERRVPYVVSKSAGFNEIPIQGEATTNRGCQLRNFNAVRQSLPKMVVMFYWEKLCLVAKPT
jgi:hypothetical protein